VERIEAPFAEAHLEGAWLVVAASLPEVNADVARLAEARQLFVNAVDDCDNASAYLGGVFRRGEVTVAISTQGHAPALAGLLREGLEALVPDEVEQWVQQASALRAQHKREGVPHPLRREQLLAALTWLHAHRAPRPAHGFVSLVGAGPGDPELLTQKALRCLGEADLVLFDALVGEQVLALAPKARRFDVGKRSARRGATRGSTAQDTIHRLMIRAARRGQRVVRLKGGDPFIFGRGGEEALALAQAGVSFEVVPGVSAALAAPALAGVPLTHRGLAAAFLVLSGHDEALWERVLAATVPQAVTLVVLMGIATRARLKDFLLRRGWAPSTPAVASFGASTESASRWVGTLESLETVPDDGVSPGVLVLGAVAGLARALQPDAEPVSQAERAR
jgi:uroporphyrin-III C-methyltransferase/precorrin-2 dehydrogenase/sirohydrochlorin ferrochelatase